MINIIGNDTSVALAKHYTALHKKATNSINASSLPNYLRDFLKLKLDDILKGLPNTLEPIQKEYYKVVRGKKKKANNAAIKRIFSYDNFITKKKEYNAYDLASNLKIDCCPYCNRQYTITINKKISNEQITRPEFDHYFPKSKYPLLAISFYNLIPSCTICNSTFKGKTEFDLKKHLHPYIDNIINDFEFDYEPLASASGSSWKNGVEVKIVNKAIGDDKDRIDNTFKLFKILEVYNAHSSVVCNILNLKDSINGDYLEILANNTYTGLNTTPSELYSLAFGNYLDPKDFNKKPFSKLTKDILIKETMLETLAKCTK
jgi:hypothetical protein